MATIGPLILGAVISRAGIAGRSSNRLLREYCIYEMRPVYKVYFRVEMRAFAHCISLLQRHVEDKEQESRRSHWREQNLFSVQALSNQRE